MVPIVIMMFVMGVYPKPFLSKIEPTVKEIIEVTDNKIAFSNIEKPEIFKK